jgi:ATP-dependent Clp protease protease subunit
MNKQMIGYCCMMLLIPTLVLSSSVGSLPESYDNLDYPLINLTADNLVVLRGTVNMESVSNVIEQLHAVGNDSVYLYINSPGGSVVDGYHLVQTIDALYKSGKTVICIADTAISMAFVIFQSCPVRYIRPSSILMQHQMSFGIRGSIEQVKNYVSFVDNMEEEINIRQALRIGMPVTEFKDKIMNDWWTYGYQTIEHNLADEMVFMLCDKELMEQTTVTVINTWFGPVTLHYSGCPLLNYPKKILFDSEDNINIEDKKMITDLLMSINDPIKAMNNYNDYRKMILGCN